MSGSLKDLLKALHNAFTSNAANLDTDELDKLLKLYIEKHTPATESDRSKLNHELLQLYRRDISSTKVASFLYILKVLRHDYIVEAEFCTTWWDNILEPLLSAVENSRRTMTMSRDICMDIVVFSDDDPDFKLRHAAAQAMKLRFFETYFAAKREQNTNISNGLELLLLNYAKRRTLDFFDSIDAYFCEPKHRLQSLALLSTFMRFQTQYIYQIYESSLLNSILNSLQLDSSTTVVSLSVTVIIMAIPHIPNRLPAILDKLFTIFARLLCWDRLRLVQRRMNSLIEVESASSQEKELEPQLIADNWARVDASFDISQTTPPRCGQLFTFLYGLYPLNFVAFLKAPAAYSKTSAELLGREDIDDEMIRARSLPLSNRHILHPNFTSYTRESELTDQRRWTQLETSDVVNMCIALDSAVAEVASPHLAAKPPKQYPPNFNLEIASDTLSFQDEVSNPSQNASRLASPAFGPIDRKGRPAVPLPDTAHTYLHAFGAIEELSLDEGSSESRSTRYHRELLLLQNELNFERHLKQQHIQHIGRLQRSQIADANMETERQNLYNTTKALKIKVSNLENTLKALRAEAVTSKTNRIQYEATLNDRIKRLREDKQSLTTTNETLQANLDQAQQDVTNMRSSLGVAEGLAFNLKQQLQVLQPEIQATKDLQKNFDLLKKRIKEAELQDIQLRFERERVTIAQSRAQEMQIKYDALLQEFENVSSSGSDVHEQKASFEHFEHNETMTELLDKTANIARQKDKAIELLEERLRSVSTRESGLQAQIHDLRAELEALKLSAAHAAEVAKHNDARPKSSIVTSPQASTDRLVPRRSSTASSLVSSSTGVHGSRRVDAIVSSSEQRLSSMSAPASAAVSTTTVNVSGVKSSQSPSSPHHSTASKKENKVLGGRFRW